MASRARQAYGVGLTCPGCAILGLRHRKGKWVRSRQVARRPLVNIFTPFKTEEVIVASISPLYDKVLLVKQNINDVSHSPLLNYINLNFIYKIEQESGDSLFLSAADKISKYCDKILKNIQDIDSARSLKEAYSEAYMLSKLRSMVCIKSNPEIHGVKTPDFEVNFNNETFFIEMKSMSMLNGNLIYNDIMEESLTGKIEIEEQLSKGKRIAFSVQVIQPYYKGQANYSSASSLIPIEAIIEKISQNIKEGQFKSKALLLIDFSDQLCLNSSPEQAMSEEISTNSREMFSGILWHVALGRIGQNIYRCDPGMTSRLEGPLTKNGILVEHEFVKGIVFHIDNNYFSFCINKHDSFDKNINDFLEYISKEHCFKTHFPKTI